MTLIVHNPKTYLCIAGLEHFRRRQEEKRQAAAERRRSYREEHPTIDYERT